MMIDTELFIIIFSLRKAINIGIIKALGVSIYFTIGRWPIFKVIILVTILLFVFGRLDW